MPTKGTAGSHSDKDRQGERALRQHLAALYPHHSGEQSEWQGVQRDDPVEDRGLLAVEILC